MVIKMFEEKYTSIWENVVILAKEGREDTKQSFQVQKFCCPTMKTSANKSSQNKHISQGALTAVSELERGHQDVVDSIQCVAYTLGGGGISESQAKSKLERALLRISKPVSWLSLEYTSTGVNRKPTKIKTVWQGFQIILKLSGRVNQASLKLSAVFANTVCWTSSTFFALQIA